MPQAATVVSTGNAAPDPNTVTAPDLFGTDNAILISVGTNRQCQSTDNFVNASEVVFNESGADVDFRVEGDTATHLFQVDASAGAVNVGTTTAGAIAKFTPSAVTINDNGGDIDFHVEGDTATNLFHVDAALETVYIGTTTIGAICYFNPAIINFNGGNADIDFVVEGVTATNLFKCDAGTDTVFIGTTTVGDIAAFAPTAIIFNESGADRDFRVEGDTATQLFVTDAGLDAVRIGGTSAGTLAHFASAGAVLNEEGADRDLRVEGDSLEYMFFCDASAATENIALLTTASPNWQSMDRGIFIGDATTAPTGNPSAGIFLWSESGELKARDGSGNVVTLTDASSGGVDVTDESTPVTTASVLNFTGAGVTATDTGMGVVDIDIPGGSSSVMEGPLTSSWDFSTTTTDADPGAGIFRLNNSSIVSITEMYVDDVDNLTVNWANVLNDSVFPTNTGTTGYIRISHVSDPSLYLLFRFDTITFASGYMKFVGQTVGGSWSSVPSNGTDCIVAFVASPPDNLAAAVTTYDIQVFYNGGSTTWTKPANAVTVRRYLIGGGGGGGGGRRGATSTVRGGGGGGGGGGYSFDSNPASEFAGTETIAVGAAGAAGTGATASTTNGSNGGAGGNTSMTATGTGGATLTANGGAGGTGGSTGGAAAGGAGGTGTTENGGAGGTGAGGGSTGTFGASTTGKMAGAGGGGGWGGTSGNGNDAGGYGGDSGGLGGQWGASTGSTPSANNGIDGHPGAAFMLPDGTPVNFGGGGGGGAMWSSTATGVVGAIGGRGNFYGAGGGGGGGNTNGATGFNQGEIGAPGIAIIVTECQA